MDEDRRCSGSVSGDEQGQRDDCRAHSSYHRTVKRALAVVLFLGCGGAPKKPVEVAKAPPPAPKPVAATTDCAGAARAVIAEHGTTKLRDRDKAKVAGEAEMMAACMDDQWDQPTIACMTTRAAPSTCADQLHEDQNEKFKGRLMLWETGWSTEKQDVAQDDPPPPPEDDDATPGELPKKQTPPREEYVSCMDSLGAVESYAPEIGAKVADREYVVGVRTEALRHACEFHWQNAEKKCFGAATSAAAVAACRAQLAPADQNVINNSLADAAAQVTAVLALTKKPAQIECGAIASVHYSDEFSRNKLTSLDPAERKRVFTESRAAMAGACTKEKWPATARACLALSKPNEFGTDNCFTGKDAFSMGMRFGLPAQGVFFKTGLAECDALTETVKKINACPQLEERMKKMILGTYSMRLSMWLESPGGSRLEAIKECKENQEWYTREASQRGCAL